MIVNDIIQHYSGKCEKYYRVRGDVEYKKISSFEFGTPIWLLASEVIYFDFSYNNMYIDIERTPFSI